jgi:Mg/Co/Ni transporter MgtE
MSTAELKQIKLNLVTWINQLSDNDLITFLEGVRISTANTDWLEGLSTDQKKQILSGMKDADEGKVMESMEFWESLSNA